jgi:hypothetical protein
MPRKRKIRILLFVILNLALLAITFNLFLAWEDRCEECYSLKRSETVREAENKGSLINRYWVKSFLISSDLTFEVSRRDFWLEHVKYVNSIKNISLDDTLLLWSEPNTLGPISFYRSVLGEDKARALGIEYGSVHENLEDSIEFNVFVEEQVRQGEFVYIKEE